MRHGQTTAKRGDGGVVGSLHRENAGFGADSGQIMSQVADQMGGNEKMDVSLGDSLSVAST